MNSETRKEEPNDRDRQVGYTLVELLGVSAIIVFVVLATQGMMHNYRRFGIEETAVERLKELSRAEDTFRHLDNPVINPDRVYATFAQLQEAGLVPNLFETSDVRMHTVNAFVPFYKLEFVQNEDDPIRPDKDNSIKPDQYGYLVRAAPIANGLGLKTFFMREDGEVYWRRYGFQYWPR
jgi:hypothetical protein